MDLKEIYEGVISGNRDVVSSGVQAALDEGVAPSTLLFDALIPAMSEPVRDSTRGTRTPARATDSRSAAGAREHV